MARRITVNKSSGRCRCDTLREPFLPTHNLPSAPGSGSCCASSTDNIRPWVCRSVGKLRPFGGDSTTSTRSGPNTRSLLLPEACLFHLPTRHRPKSLSLDLGRLPHVPRTPHRISIASQCRWARGPNPWHPTTAPPTSDRLWCQQPAQATRGPHLRSNPGPRLLLQLSAWVQGMVQTRISHRER